jgi:hypothetical protein
MATELAKGHVYDYAKAWRSGAVALRIVRDVASGLAHAHEKKLMHRDVKPENVLVFADGHAALTDFGVSRFIRPESRSYTEAGTMGYMAPEQAYGKPTLASDVFSLGVIAYELLTGELLAWPFPWPPKGHDRFVAKVPEPVRPVLRRACAFDPADRYPSAVELHAALEAAFRKLDEERRAPWAPAAGARSRRRLHRSRSAWSCSAGGWPSARHALPLPPLRRPDRRAMSVCPGAARRTTPSPRSRAPLMCPHCGRGVLPSGRLPVVLRGPLQGNGRPPRPDPLAVRRCVRRGCPGSCARSCATARSASRSRGAPGATPISPTAARAAAGPSRAPSGASAPGAGGGSGRPEPRRPVRGSRARTGLECFRRTSRAARGRRSQLPRARR